MRGTCSQVAATTSPATSPPSSPCASAASLYVYCLTNRGGDWCGSPAGRVCIDRGKWLQHRRRSHRQSGAEGTVLLVVDGETGTGNGTHTPSRHTHTGQAGERALGRWLRASGRGALRWWPVVRSRFVFVLRGSRKGCANWERTLTSSVLRVGQCLRCRHTWFDRYAPLPSHASPWLYPLCLRVCVCCSDLTIAGRVMVKHGEDYVSRLVKIDRYAHSHPNTHALVLRVPSGGDLHACCIDKLVALCVCLCM